MTGSIPSDFPPLTREAFRAALEKGQGRAWLHVQEHGTAGMEEELLHACLHNVIYDAQLEDGRSGWLFDMVRQSPDPGRFAAAISAALPAAVEDRDAWQLGNLARRLAEEGDEAARQALYTRLEGPLRRSSDDCATAVIDLDGLDGLLRVAEMRGRRLLAEPEGWNDEGACGHAEEICGEEAVRAALEDAAARSAAVRAYRHAVEEDRRQRDEPHETPPRPGLAAILSDIEAAAGLYPGPYMYFGRRASQEDAEAVFSLLLTETRREQLLRCLWVFLQRPVPRCEELLLRLAESNDDKIQEASCMALAGTRDPRVRALALRFLERPETLPRSSLRLFSGNLEAGDPDRIEAALWVPEDRREMHSITWDLLELVQEYPGVSFTRLLLWIAEHNPCSLCRARALKRLIKSGEAPEELVRECLSDADEEARELAEAWIGRQSE